MGCVVGSAGWLVLGLKAAAVSWLGVVDVGWIA